MFVKLVWSHFDTEAKKDEKDLYLGYQWYEISQEISLKIALLCLESKRYENT